MEGIDLYTKYQTVTDWNRVHSAGKTFCYVKVSDGTTAKPTNGWGPAAKAAGIAVGAYHYAQPGDPIAQADLLISQAAANGLTDLGRALDLEAPFVPGATAANFAIAFLRRIRDRGFLPVLYGSDSMLSYVAPQVRAAVPETWIWVARYGANPKTPWNTWQYSDAGSVPGVTASAVDLNTGSIPMNSTPQENDLTPEEHAWLSYVYAVLQRYPDTSTGGLNNTWDAGENTRRLIGRVDALKAQVAALSVPQPAPVDLDALAAKVAPLVASAVGGAVATAVAAELAKRLEA